MPKRLPSNIFADSPLRPTDTSEGALDSAVVPEGQALNSDSDATAAPAHAAETRRLKSVASAPSPETEVRKLTVYLPDEHLQAIDDEVYLRRKSGERSLSFAELHREIVEEWVSRRRRRTASPS